MAHKSLHVETRAESLRDLTSQVFNDGCTSPLGDPLTWTFFYISARLEALRRNRVSGPDAGERAGVSRRHSSTQTQLQLEHGF